MDKELHTTFYNVCNYLSMMGLKLIRIGKTAHHLNDRRLSRSPRRLILTQSPSTSVTAGIGPEYHEDVIKWKHFPRYWPFVRGIRRSPTSFDVFFDMCLNKRLSKQS